MTTSLWAACALLAVAASGGLVVLVGLAMAYSDRDLRGFVEHVSAAVPTTPIG